MCVLEVHPDKSLTLWILEKEMALTLLCRIVFLLCRSVQADAGLEFSAVKEQARAMRGLWVRVGYCNGLRKLQLEGRISPA